MREAQELHAGDSAEGSSPATPTPTPPEEPIDNDLRPIWPARYGIFALITALMTTVIAGPLALTPFLPIALIEHDDIVGMTFLFLGTVVQDSIFCVSAYSFASVAQPFKFVQFGLRRVKFRRGLLWVGIGIAIYVPFEILWNTFVYHGGESDPGIAGQHPIAIGLFGILAIVVAPATEEFLFRGFMYQAFRNRLGVAFAAILDGVLFGLLHAADYSMLQLVPLIPFGIVACIAFERTKSLYPPIAMHVLNNAAVFVIALV